jgi:chromosome partitioning protein
VEQALGCFDVPVLASKISQRVIYAESASAGLSVFEQNSRSAAASEIRDVAEEILSMLGGD